MLFLFVLEFHAFTFFKNKVLNNFLRNLIAFYTSFTIIQNKFFIWCPNFGPFLSIKTQSPDVNHCTLTLIFKGHGGLATVLDP